MYLWGNFVLTAVFQTLDLNNFPIAASPGHRELDHGPGLRQHVRRPAVLLPLQRQGSLRVSPSCLLPGRRDIITLRSGVNIVPRPSSVCSNVHVFLRSGWTTCHLRRGRTWCRRWTSPTARPLTSSTSESYLHWCLKFFVLFSVMCRVVSCSFVFYYSSSWWTKLFLPSGTSRRLVGQC